MKLIHITVDLDMVGYTERDIDDLTNIYINQVVYPEEFHDEDQDGNENQHSKANILEMPKSIYVTTVSFKNEPITLPEVQFLVTYRCFQSRRAKNRI